MSDFFDEKIAEFLRACQNRNVKLLMVGGVSRRGNITYQVISLEDFITSKERSGRPKDRLDILELEKRNKQ